jgi:hypothetical protein
MATRDIFASVDVQGVLDTYLATVVDFYGFDPSKDMTPEQQQRLLKINLTDYTKGSPYSICRIGYTDQKALPSYTRLVACKSSTVGWEIRPQDTVTVGGKQYLANAYYLAIRAKNGDTIRWWGHDITPDHDVQAIVSNVDQPGSSTQPPPEFTEYRRDNASFFYASSAVDPQALNKGAIIATQNAYYLSCVLNSAPKTISYDVEILLLSKPFMNRSRIIGVPFVKLVVDPEVIVEL